jgi:hypothetical protein
MPNNHSQPTPTSGQKAAAPQPDDKVRPAGWRKQSHSNDVDPNHDIVFPISAVNTLKITIAPEDWAAMQADMEEIYGEERDGAKAFEQMSEEQRLAFIQESMAAKVDPTGGAFTLRPPIWIPATISFQDQLWTHVGVRYKGASSLSPWMKGEIRLPFKFDFDQFEDDYPQIKNQRFFGFKQLSLSTNYEDASAMRDTLVYELLLEAGLPSLRTASYDVLLEYGEGPVRLGLYTMIEVVDDTGIRNHFGNDNGNLYEGNGLGASLAKQKKERIKDSYEKKNNEDAADWGDIWALYDVLHAEKRLSDPEAWRADLEALFEVDSFLKWLGIAAFVGHGDTYGVAGHNFYIYNNPETGKLTWVSWDHNVTFRSELRPFLVLDKSNISDAWPLIRYLLDDPVYWDRYVAFMADNFATVLAPDAMIARIRARAELLLPYATLDMSREAYDSAVQQLVAFVEARAADVEEFLAEQK